MFTSETIGSISSDPISNIAKLIQLIYDQAKLVKKNKEDCDALIKSIKIIESAIKGLDTIKNCEQYELALQSLVKCLAECLEFTKKFNDSNVLASGFFKTSQYKSRFDELESDLGRAMQQLNLALSSQHVVNQSDMINSLAKAIEELKILRGQEQGQRTRSFSPTASSISNTNASSVINQQQVDQQNLSKFLLHVSRGEQQAAQAMLNIDPTLALKSGDVTDLSRRYFRGITAFQYAIWALDVHMWQMIRQYLPSEAAKEQCQGIEGGAWVREHNIHINWNSLTNALGKFADLYNNQKLEDASNTWLSEVGRAEWLLPVHVVNHYCNHLQSFHPTPDFEALTDLPRTRTVGDKQEKDWYQTLDPEKRTHAIWRGNNERARMVGADGIKARRDETRGKHYDRATIANFDQRTLVVLYNARTKQRNLLLDELVPKKTLTNK